MVGVAAAAHARPLHRRRSVRGGLAGLCAAFAVVAASGASAACPGLEGALRGPSGAFDTDALLRLADIKGFAPSPDGRTVAVLVQRADPQANRYTAQWMFGDADCRGRFVPFDTEGQAVPARSYGGAHGHVPIEDPRWSPDGRFLAYRKIRDEVIELWVADRNRGSAWRVGPGTADVERFLWLSSGALAFSTGLNPTRAAAMIREEGDTGWLYDARFHPSSGQIRPMTPDCARSPGHPACENGLFVADPALGAGGAVRAPSSVEQLAWDGQGALPETLSPRRDTRPTFVTASRRGDLAWAETADPAVQRGPNPLRRVASNRPGGRPCAAPACTGAIQGVWWTPDGRGVVFASREGASGRADRTPFDISALYRWDLASGHVRRLLRTANAVDNCKSTARAELLCLLETPRRPARIVRLDLVSARVSVVLDPNPDMPSLADLKIEATRYTDSRGLAGYYIVVRAPQPAAGPPRPVVVVQYRARGFLRGGVGDEYPILPLAQRGYVVVVMNHASDPAQVRGAMAIERDRLQPGLPERRAWTAAILTAVDRLVAEGVADPDRVALTGLSAGVETLHYALQRTDRFAAAIASSGPAELDFLALTTPLYNDFKAIYGDERIFEPDSILREMAWSTHVPQLRTPLLVNVTSREFLMGLEGFAALRDAGRPLEVRVFEDTGKHIKFDPANRKAVYELNLAWLDYWLKGERSGDPALAGQFARWDAMAAQLAAERRNAPSNDRAR